MTEHKISSTSIGSTGKYIELNNDAPIAGITVDEYDETVTIHEDERVESLEEALRHLIAIERDRLLGYPSDELHTRPKSALQRALRSLEAVGCNTDEVIFPEDKEALDLD